MSDRMQRINSALEETIQVKQSFSEELKNRILSAADAMVEALRQGRRIFVLGNGGSAADAQHLECELVGRFLKERKALDVIALTTNSSTLTCLINDYPPEKVFARQIQAHTQEGDIVIGISTSGNSPNVIKALTEAKNKGAKTIGISGISGGEMLDWCDILLNVPSRVTPRIQESHVFIIHLICELVEEVFEKE